MGKHTLLLSAAAISLFAGSAWAVSSTTTTISSSTSTALMTGTSDDDDITGDAGNVYITSDGAIKFETSSTTAITVDSDSYVYSNGVIQINDKSAVRGIEIDLTGDTYTDEETAWDMSDSVIVTEDGTTITGAAIYLDSSSVIKLAGDSGSSKYGIYLNDSDTDCDDCTLTGDIIIAEGAEIYLKGSSSRGIYFEKGTELIGDIQIDGTIEVYQMTETSTSSSSLYGMYILGGVDGSIDVSSTGSVSAYGAGAKAMYLSGSGITGSLTIEGTVLAEGIDDIENDSFDWTDKDDTWPEAAAALSVGASVGGGVAISGSVVTYGTGEAVYINPSLTYGSSTYDDVESLVLGAYEYDEDGDDDTYADCAGYGFCNLGTISITPINANSSATAAVYIVGGGSQYPTIVEGGFYNSGTISTSVRNMTKSPSTVSTVALYLSGYVYFGGTYDDSTGTYTGDFVTSSATDSNCTSDSGYCYYIGDEDDIDSATPVGDATEYGSLVNTGTISATKTGTGAGSTTAIYISSDSDVTSIVNTGTILAYSEVSDDYTDDVTSLSSYAIIDYSGSLTYIYNSGTIEAFSTQLDDDYQVNYAIYLYGNTASASGDGVTIISEATSSSSALIYGDIVLGEGDNQQLYLYGYSSTYTSLVYGDITYQGSVSAGIDNGDLLYIGSYATVTGEVTATNGVEVDIEDNGALYLLNDDTSLYVSELNLYSGGTLSISVSEEMDEDGAISALSEGSVYIESGASLAVAYNSFVPLSSDEAYSYLLIRADSGSLDVDDDVLEDAQETINESLPFLFSSASLEETTSSDGAYDELLLNVTAKAVGSDDDELNLTGYAKKMYSYINTALEVDPDLGSAMINDIGDGCGELEADDDGGYSCSGDTTLAEAQSEAQAAYNSYAPDMTGAARAVAIMLTDSTSGPVAARQRSLREFSRNEEDEWTFWMQGFVQRTNADGQGAVGADGSYAKNGYKEKGFGFSFGLDTGSPRYGWYGGALTFYNANMRETGRNSHNNQLWLVLSGYSTWHGKHLFLDTKVDVGYARIRGRRYIYLTNSSDDDYDYDRESDSVHAAESLSGSAVLGAEFVSGDFHFLPQISVDGLLMRQEGYAETNPDSTTSDEKAFLLDVNVQHNRSLRGAIGTSVHYDWNLWGVPLQPEVHANYRYDFIHDRIRAYVAFKDIDTNLSGNQHSDRFMLTGLDPSRGNLIGGGSLSTKGQDWSINLNFDYIRGQMGQTQEVGSLGFLVRF